MCNLARYWLQAPWGWHDTVETCSSVIICEIIVHLLVTVQNKRLTVHVLKYVLIVFTKWDNLPIHDGHNIFGVHYWQEALGRGQTIFCSGKRQTVPGPHPACYSVDTRGSFPGVKRTGREFKHRSPSSAQVKNEWSWTSSVPLHLRDFQRTSLTLTELRWVGHAARMRGVINMYRILAEKSEDVTSEAYTWTLG
jgi:hypothetical protein